MIRVRTIYRSSYTYVPRVFIFNVTFIDRYKQMNIIAIERALDRNLVVIKFQFVFGDHREETFRLSFLILFFFFCYLILRKMSGEILKEEGRDRFERD